MNFFFFFTKTGSVEVIPKLPVSRMLPLELNRHSLKDSLFHFLVLIFWPDETEIDFLNYRLLLEPHINVKTFFKNLIDGFFRVSCFTEIEKER